MRLSVSTVALATLITLSAAPCHAQFRSLAGQGSETISIGIAGSALSNNYILFPGANNGTEASLDAGSTASVPIVIAVNGLTPGTKVNLNLTASAGNPGAGAPVIGYTFSLMIASGQPIQIPINVDATNAKPGNYQLLLTATDANSNVVGSSPPRGLLITTPAGDFKSLFASTRMTLTLAGTRLLVKAMTATGSVDIATGGAHYRMIFHNTGTSTIQVSSGNAAFLLAPGDVLAADFSTQFDVVATVFDGSTGTLDIGYP